jgi:hypothetical protein
MSVPNLDWIHTNCLNPDLELESMSYYGSMNEKITVPNFSWSLEILYNGPGRNTILN